MNRNTLPHPADQPGDLDRLFGAYFKAQLPQQWPQAPAPKSEVAGRTPARQESHDGRVTLAASVACLLGLGLALSYGPSFQGQAGPNGDLLQNGNANGSKLQPHMAPDQQPKLPTP